MRCVFALVLTVAAAHGQFTGTGAISGIVIESSNRDPVVKAVVTLTLQGSPRAWATTRTDSSGRFTFDTLPAGKYDLRAEKAGLGTAIHGAESLLETGSLIPLGDGERRNGLQLRFVRSAVITGKVIDPNGYPVPLAEVTLLRPARNLGERILAHYRGSVADDHGEYRIANIEPGDYYLKVDPPEMHSSGIAPAHRLGPRYYGGGDEPRDSNTISVRSGSQLNGMDFHLAIAPEYVIRGRVTGVPSGPPPSDDNLEVFINPVTDGGFQWGNGESVKGPDYRFELPGLMGGIYRIEARWQAAESPLLASQIVDARQLAGEIELHLAPVRDIKGRLRIEGQSHRPGDLQLQLLARGEIGFIVARPAADGSFTLSNVPPSERSLNVASLPPGMFLKSAQFGGKDVRFRRFTVEPNSDAAFDIVVSSRMAKVNGTVEGGAKHAGIVLAPVGDLRTFERFYYGGVTDDEGNFELGDIAPGKYKIFALEQLAARNFSNPEATGKLDAFGEDVELREGETSTVNPHLIGVDRARQALPPGLRQ